MGIRHYLHPLTSLVVSVIGLQLPSEHRSGAGKPRLHIVERDSGRIRDLVIAQPLDLAQYDNLAIVGRKALHSLKDLLLKLLLFQHDLGRIFEVGKLPTAETLIAFPVPWLIQRL